MSNHTAPSNATWTIPVDHPVFAGHFPGMPIVPGVMLLDAMLHTITAATGLAPDRCEISSVKFLGSARPGETLLMEHAALPNGAIRFDIITADGRRRIASGALAPSEPAINSAGAVT